MVSKQLDWNTGGLSVATSLEISMWVGTSLCECVLVSQQPNCLLQPFSSSLTLCPCRRVMYLIFIKPTFVFFTAIFSGSSSAAISNSKISLAFCRVSTPLADHALVIVFLHCSSAIIMYCELNLIHASVNQIPVNNVITSCGLTQNLSPKYMKTCDVITRSFPLLSD